MPDHNESRPQAADLGAAKSFGGDYPQSTGLAARARRHDHGVLVLAERRDGIVTSQVFADLAASLQLVRLLPVRHVDLDDGGAHD